MYALIDGGMPPRGKVKVSGAKNSATRLLAASLLGNDKSVLGNFPTKLVDVEHKIKFCRDIGAKVIVDHSLETISVDASDLTAKKLTRDQYDIPIRTTYLLAASQLLRSGIARIPYPGGCPIGGGAAGKRGYDLHIMVWENLGCVIEERDDHIEIQASNGMTGGAVSFPISTVGGTENALLCATVAKGRTEISNAYITPEVGDLIEFLTRMGAEISLQGTSNIIVEGKGGPLEGAKMDVMSDRIEALTWMVYAILSKGELWIEGVPFDTMRVPLLHIEHSGVNMFENSNSVRISPECIQYGGVQPFELACGAYPGVISDMQAFFVMLALGSKGTSRVYDYRYPERIGFVKELAKFTDAGTLLSERGKVTVKGPTVFKPAVADSTDLRGSMAVVMAALCADGRSVVKNVQMALRGYNNLQMKLSEIGSHIEVRGGDFNE